MKHVTLVVNKFRKWSLIVGAWLKRRVYSHTTVIGITGSAGKTTTKELCTSVLSEFGDCIGTRKSWNSWKSSAQLMIEMKRSTQYCVAEMGVMRPGSLDRSLEILKPTIGVFTIVARDHYSNFKSLEAIAQEKSKLINALPPHGTAIINIDDALVRDAGEHAPCSVITFGRDPKANIRLLSARSAWPQPLALNVSVFGQEYHVRTSLHGEHLAINVLATLGVACALKLPIDRVVCALASAAETEGRMQTVIAADGITYLRDDFKAPHWSFHAPLEVLKSANVPRKVAVIGTVSDSPRSPSVRYLKIAREVRKVADLAIFVGRDAEKALKARTSPEDMSIQAFPRLRDANDFLKTELRSGDLVLLKGSGKQDHLVRLMMDRERAMSCWRENCQKEEFCTSCQHAYEQPSDELTASHVDGVKPVFGAVADDTVQVIVGLGNPGKQYADTVHNAGHAMLEFLARDQGVTWTRCDQGDECEIDLAGERVRLLKPALKMNKSGAPLRDYLQAVGGHPQLLTVVHDALDLKLGDVRIKRGGGDGGHRGLRSVITALGTSEFPRMKIGVGSEEDVRDVRKLVLQRFSPDQIGVLSASYAQGLELLQVALQRRTLRINAEEARNINA